MNVLSDFILRVEAQYPSSIENEELNSLLKTIQNQGREIQQLEKKIAKYEGAGAQGKLAKSGKQGKPEKPRKPGKLGKIEETL